jgi:hypothetical protein
MAEAPIMDITNRRNKKPNVSLKAFVNSSSLAKAIF